MESDQILEQVQISAETPESWIVLPILRRKVIVGILGWIVSALLGGLLFAFMAPIMIPHNYQSGAIIAIISTLILVVVLFVCLGSLWSLVVDILRLSHASEHIIVITPDDFVKQEGKKIVHVPLEYVKYVTARGAPPAQRDSATAREDARIRSSGENLTGFIFSRRFSEIGRRGPNRRRMRTPTTLAFIDSRTDNEVVVATDKAYGDPYAIAANLKAYASSAQNRSTV